MNEDIIPGQIPTEDIETPKQRREFKETAQARISALDEKVHYLERDIMDIKRYLQQSGQMGRDYSKPPNYGPYGQAPF